MAVAGSPALVRKVTSMVSFSPNPFRKPVRESYTAYTCGPMACFKDGTTVSLSSVLPASLYNTLSCTASVAEFRKGKAGKTNEFGKMVKLQEAENQIVTDYEVYDRRPSDSDLLIGAVEAHQARLGRTPRLVAADAAFYSAKNEVAAKAKGVKRFCVPNRSTKSAERKREQKKRWFRNGQKWRTGCEGRISVGKRRHGLSRCRYKGEAGMKRWVGLGVIADNILSIGRPKKKQKAP